MEKIKKKLRLVKLKKAEYERLGSTMKIYKKISMIYEEIISQLSSVFANQSWRNGAADQEVMILNPEYFFTDSEINCLNKINQALYNTVVVDEKIDYYHKLIQCILQYYFGTDKMFNQSFEAVIDELRFKGILDDGPISNIDFNQGRYESITSLHDEIVIKDFVIDETRYCT